MMHHYYCEGLSINDGYDAMDYHSALFVKPHGA